MIKLAIILAFIFLCHVDHTERAIEPVVFSSSSSLGIENLPFELQRNFNLMRDLDQRTEGENNELGSFHCFSAWEKDLQMDHKRRLMVARNGGKTKLRKKHFPPFAPLYFVFLMPLKTQLPLLCPVFIRHLLHVVKVDHMITLT